MASTKELEKAKPKAQIIMLNMTLSNKEEETNKDIKVVVMTPDVPVVINVDLKSPSIITEKIEALNSKTKKLKRTSVPSKILNPNQQVRNLPSPGRLSNRTQEQM